MDLGLGKVVEHSLDGTEYSLMIRKTEKTKGILVCQSLEGLTSSSLLQQPQGV